MLVFPPATPFTYHVTIVVVVLVSVVFESVACAVKLAVVLICTVAEAGEIVTAVTVTWPLPPPHDEMLIRQASATGSSTNPRIHFRIARPSLFVWFAHEPPLRALPSPVRAPANLIAMRVFPFPLCCLVICLGPLILARHWWTHTWLPVFPCRKKKFQFLEVSTQDSVARQMLIPRAPHPIDAH